ncbi:MAG: hypothetical protein KAW12_07285 [Candidatus Aminicenantes bacterium]|nr:hypothetical protein [Candidatus Aminicenantes bacterium]
MANILFFYKNDWDTPEAGCSSAHSSFPVANTQERILMKPWRSNYGPGSGWGTFKIDETNRYICFQETGQPQQSAEISTGTFNAATLAAEIELQMEASGTHDFIVWYDEEQNKFRIASNTGTFAVLGSQTTNAIWSTIGFDEVDTEDTLDSYTANEVRIHTAEWLKINSANVTVAGVFVFHHNIQNSGDVKVQFSNDDFITIEYEYSLLKGDGVMVKLLHPSPLQYNDIRIFIQDKSNPAGYVEFGRVWLGDCFEPKHGFSPNFSDKPKDLSRVIVGGGGQAFSLINPHIQNQSYSFGLADPKDKFDEIFNEVGLAKPLVIVEKPLTPISAEYLEPEKHSHYCRLSSWSMKHESGNKFSLKTGRTEEK